MNDYERIARVIRYLDQHTLDRPDLAVLARQAGLSRFHFNRLFSRWAGLSPMEFLQCLTLAHVKRLLHQGRSVLETAFQSGLSGPGRLHDLCVTLEAASPGEVKSGGAGWTIEADFAHSPFGLCLVGASPRGICHLSFTDSSHRDAGARAIGQNWPRARVDWNQGMASDILERIFARPSTPIPQPPLRAWVRGSHFQVRVWRALLQIPKGTLATYGQVAAAIGHPRAARAVGTAVGQNPLACLIPCHRVIRETGVLGQYRWGATRKQALVAWESSAGAGL